MHPVPRFLLVSGALMLAAQVAASDITSTQLGDNTG
jgi:hypothetical protein